MRAWLDAVGTAEYGDDWDPREWTGEWDLGHDSFDEFYAAEVASRDGVHMADGGDRPYSIRTAAETDAPLNCVGKNVSGAMTGELAYGRTFEPVVQYDERLDERGVVKPTGGHFHIRDADTGTRYGKQDWEEEQVLPEQGFVAAYLWDMGVDAFARGDHTRGRTLVGAIDDLGLDSDYFDSRVERVDSMNATLIDTDMGFDTPG